jgi:hypothetical protein
LSSSRASCVSASSAFSNHRWMVAPTSSCSPVALLTWWIAAMTRHPICPTATSRRSSPSSRMSTPIWTRWARRWTRPAGKVCPNGVHDGSKRSESLRMRSLSCANTGKNLAVAEGFEPYSPVLVGAPGADNIGDIGAVIDVENSIGQWMRPVVRKQPFAGPIQSVVAEDHFERTRIGARTHRGVNGFDSCCRHFGAPTTVGAPW